MVVKLALARSAIEGGSSALLASLAPLFVTLTIGVGIVTNRLHAPWFLSVLCAGWAFLMGVRYALEPAAGDALIGAFAALLVVYYGLRYYRNRVPDDRDSDDSSDSTAVPTDR